MPLNAIHAFMCYDIPCFPQICSYIGKCYKNNNVTKTNGPEIEKYSIS